MAQKKERGEKQALPSEEGIKSLEWQCLILLFAFAVMLPVQGRVHFFDVVSDEGLSLIHI